MPTAIELAEQFQASLVGEASSEFAGLAPLERAQKNQISFLSNPLYRQQASDSGAGALIVSKADLDFLQANPGTNSAQRVYFVSKNPYATFARMAQHFAKNSSPAYAPGVHASAAIDPTAHIPSSCHVGPFVQVEAGVKLGERVAILGNTTIARNSVIGSDTLIYPSVSIYFGTQMGERCIIHSGAVIGADGFGFAPQADNQYAKVPQIGNVVIEDRVEIGANTSVDRATLGSTFIRKGVKLDNLIQIGHNVEIGENTVIAAQTGVAGSTKIGANCMIGGQVGIAGHITIANGCKIAAQSGISASMLKEGTVVQGSPALEIMNFKKAYIAYRRLPEWTARIEALEKGSNN